MNTYRKQQINKQMAEITAKREAKQAQQLEEMGHRNKHLVERMRFADGGSYWLTEDDEVISKKGDFHISDRLQLQKLFNEILDGFGERIALEWLTDRPAPLLKEEATDDTVGEKLVINKGFISAGGRVIYADLEGVNS